MSDDVRRLRWRTKAKVCSALRGVTQPHPRPKVLLGCSYEQLATHLGALGEDMDVDHIIPVCHYNKHDPVDWYRAFNWENTRLVTHVEHKRRPPRELPDAATLERLKHLWPNGWWGECELI
jgi:hypothetical protein